MADRSVCWNGVIRLNFDTVVVFCYHSFSFFLICVSGNRNNEGGLVWVDEEVNWWWEHSTIKMAGGRRCNGMKMKKGWVLGRGESGRVQTNRTKTATCAEDGDGNGNNDARLLLSGLFLAARRFIFVGGGGARGVGGTWRRGGGGRRRTIIVVA